MHRRWPSNAKIFSLFSGLLLSSSIGAALGQEKATEKNLKTIKLLQSHHELGNIQCFINQTALKMYFSDYRTYVIAKAPQWDLVYYNPSAHLFRKWTYADFKKNGTNLSACEEYPAVTASKENCPPIDTNKLQCFSTTTKQQEIYQLAVIASKDAAPQAIALISRLYRLPNVNGIPAKAKKFSAFPEVNKALSSSSKPGGKLHQEIRLNTSSVSLVNMATSDYKIPPNLKETKRESDISFPNSPNNAVIDMFTGDAVNSKRELK